MIRKKTKRKKWKRIIFLVLIGIITLISVILLVNILIREKFELTKKQKETLIIFFPEEHISHLSFYKGGLFSVGSTKVICSSIYFRDKSYWDKFFFNEPNNKHSLELLVHEVTHTWQARKGCFKMSFSAVYHQFTSFLKYGSRNYAYHYSLDDNIEDLNPEQEASIIQDFYSLAFQNLSRLVLCKDCPDPIDKTTFEKMKNKAEKIIEKYR